MTDGEGVGVCGWQMFSVEQMSVPLKNWQTRAIRRTVFAC